MKNSAIVMFSGGQDSATTLAWALEKYTKVETIGFTYNQRHKVELNCRKVVLDKIKEIKPYWESRLGDDHLIDLSVLSDLGKTALTEDIQIKLQENGLNSG